MTYIIAGLGNPGLKYRSTRHNAGFMVLDEISRITGIKVNKKRFSGEIGEGTYDGDKVVLLKPHTYMNRSGDSIAVILNFYKIPTENLIVIYDDIDLDVGKLRIRASGSAGTHNGMRSIIGRIKTYDFPRVRFGVGKCPGYMGLAAYVLAKLNRDEKKTFAACAERAAKAALAIISDGVAAAQGAFNGNAQ